MNDIEKAKELLSKDGNTCVLIKGDSKYVSQVKGISPMLDFLDGGISLDGYSAADKIVGKAAAMLFAYSGVIEVFAEVLSESGEAILKHHKIKYTYAKSVEYIINRSGTGLCPMEQTVKDIDDLAAARTALIEKRKILRGW